LTSSFEVKVLASKNVVEIGTNNNQKMPDLENMVGVAVYLIQSVKAFDELVNLYEVSHYLGGTLYLFY